MDLYTVKNVKRKQGALSLSLHRNGRRIAKLFLKSDGYEVYYFSHGPIVACETADGAEDRTHIEEHKIHAHVRKLGLSGPAEFVQRLIAGYESDKKLRRLCRRKTLYRLKGDAPSRWRTIDMPYAKRVRRRLLKQVGSKLDIIANEMI